MGIIRVKLNLIRRPALIKKILADNMFQNYFLISYLRHKYFLPIYVYCFTEQRCEYFYDEIISVYLLTSGRQA